MIRKLASLAALAMLGTVVGCHCVHWAGKCDCDMGCDPCAPYGRGTPANASAPGPIVSPVAPPAVAPTPVAPVPSITKPADPMPAPKSDTPPSDQKKISDGGK